MKLAPVERFGACGSTTFRGKIIDAHVHTGNWQGRSFDAKTLDTFIKSPLNISEAGRKHTDTVEKMLVSNLDCMNNDALVDETTGNMAMLKMCKDNPKLYPLAVCQPGITEGNPDAIRKLLEQNEGSFVGLKFHPEGPPLIASDKRYDPYLKLAGEKKLPCLFHSQVNIDWRPDSTGKYIPHMVNDVAKWSNSDPEFIYTLAKRHKDVPVIMAHTGAGGELAHKKAIDVMVKSLKNNDARLYCDISWMNFQDGMPVENPVSLIELIRKMKENNGLDRILFGTDVPLGCYGTDIVKDGNGNPIPPKEAYEKTVSAVKTAIRQNFGYEADDIIQKIFHDNAENVFFKKDWAKDLPKSIDTASKTMHKTKALPVILGLLALAAGIGTLIAVKIHNKGKSKQS